MFRSLYKSVFALAVTLLPHHFAVAQYLGNASPSYGMVGHYASSEPIELPMLDVTHATGYITIDGRAEVRVKPTEIRMVLAVTSTADTAQKCQQAVAETASRLKAAWTKMGIAPANMVEDFISVLPSYEWTWQKRDNEELGVEKKIGYRMQTNMHLAVKNDAEAQSAMNLAFKEGVTDIIAFDYWSRDLDETKVNVRELAVKAAQSKSKFLLGAIFKDLPAAINVQEQTTVRYPESLYRTAPNSVEQTVNDVSRRETVLVHASRPQNTYYRGLYIDGDIQPKELPMHAEISVVSTVRLYFKSPGATANNIKKNDAHTPEP